MQILHFDWLRYYMTIGNSHRVAKLAQSSVTLSFVLFPNKGPDALGKFLFILRKNLSQVASDKCARWFLDLTNFVKALPNFKDAAVLPRSRTNFCQAWNLHDLKENVNQENVISIFSRSISVRSPQKLLFLVPKRCSRKRWSLHWHSRSSNCFCWSWTNSRKKKN